MGFDYTGIDREKVNGTTLRLEVPGGWLYKVSPGGSHAPLITFVADPPLSTTIYKLGEALGNGNSVGPFGAIEGHAVMLKEASGRIAESLDAVARAIEGHE